MERKRGKLSYVFFSTLFWWMLAHGYRLIHNLYSGDSLVMVFQDDIYWQRSLGRFMQPLSLVVRGNICSPWLIGGIAILFFALGLYFISEILEIEDRIYLFAIAGILTCNMTITVALTAFLPWLDVYAVAFFLAVLGVWLYLKDKLWGYLAGSVAFICSMGFYQAYIDVALTLLAMIVIGQLLENMESPKAFFLRVGKMLGGVAASGVGYWIVFRLVCKIHNVEIANTYNGLAEVGNYENVSMIQLIKETYHRAFQNLATQGKFSSAILMGMRVSDVWKTVLFICLLVSIVLIVSGIVVLCRLHHTHTWQRICLALVVLLLPMALNFVYILSKGMEHELMIFSHFLIYVFGIYILKLVMPPAEKRRMVQPVIYLLPIFLLIWNNVVYSNQVYYKLDMEDKAAVSLATRVVDDMEDVDGYEAGTTPVVFIGSPEKSSYISSVVYLRDIQVYGNGKTPFTGDEHFPVFLQYFLNVNMNIGSAEVPEETVRNMPIYPAKDSIQFIGDTLVVKLSD